MASDVQPSGNGPDEVLISLRAPPWVRVAWPLISVIGGFGSTVWIILWPSWPAIIFGGGIIVSFGWVWATLVAARRARGGQPLQIVATRAGISSPLWSVPWDRVSRIRIGPSAGDGIWALHIETFRPDDVIWANSKVVRLNARASEAARFAPIQIPQANVDRSLSSIAADFERIAGRSLSQ